MVITFSNTSEVKAPSVWIVAGAGYAGKSEFIARHGAQFFPGHIKPFVEFFSAFQPSGADAYEGMILHWSIEAIHELSNGELDALFQRLGAAGSIACCVVVTPIDELNARMRAHQGDHYARSTREWTVPDFQACIDRLLERFAVFGGAATYVNSSGNAFIPMQHGELDDVMRRPLTGTLARLPKPTGETVRIAKLAGAPVHEIHQFSLYGGPITQIRLGLRRVKDRLKCRWG